MRSKFWKNFIGIIIVIIVTVITSLILFRNLSKSSTYQINGTLHINGISDSAYIYRDEFEVPHIEAFSQHDMYFLLGYTHAQGRLWQMDLYRRIIDGRLSEVMGKEALQYDKLFKTIGIGSKSHDIYKSLPQSTKDIIISYTDGVNEFISTHNKNLPMEFDMLNYKPEKWSEEDCIKVIRFLGWELNISWYTDYMFGQILSKFGAEKSKDFFPDYPDSFPDIIKTGKNEQRDKNDSTKDITSLEQKYAQINTALANNFIKISNNLKDRFGIKGSHIGSNAWVVSGSKTENGKPLLANDPHLPLSAPSVWFEYEMIDRSLNKRVYGFGIPGVPGILSGSNNAISWGITNLMNDETDFYIFRRDSINKSDYYIFDNKYTLDSTIEYIKIKDEKDEVPITIYYTKYGAVISNLEKSSLISNSGFNIGSKFLLTYKWVGDEKTDEIGAIASLDFSNNWNDFRSSLKNFGIPALNFIYADSSGNIGYQAAGKVPIRKYKNETTNLEHFSLLPSAGEMEWKGFIPFEELPQVYNPDNKYIVSANNKPQDSYKYFISNLFEPPYRAMRIEELLKARNNFTAAEFKLMQNDVISPQAKEFCGFLFKAFADTISSYMRKDTSNVNYRQPKLQNLNETEYACYSALKNWNYEFSLFSYQASIFSQFESELYKNLYHQQMGNELYLSYLTLAAIPVKNTSKLLREKPTQYYEILRRSFKEAIAVLTQKFNTQDITKWHWGEIHHIKMHHPLALSPNLTPLLDVGPYDVGGNGTTVNNSEYSFPSVIENGSFESFLGPSFRFVIDMSDTKYYQSILPPGESGQPLFPSYRDQARLWLNGEYKSVSTVPFNLRYECKNILLILPN